MSSDALNRTWKGSKLRGGSLLVLLAIAEHEGDHYGVDLSWPSLDRLAEMARVGRSTVIRAVATAEEAGELSVVHSDRHSNLYRVMVGRDPAEILTADDVSQALPTGGVMVTPGGVRMTPGGVMVTPEVDLDLDLEVQDQDLNHRPKRGPQKPKPTPDAPAMLLCSLLADLIEGNGSKRPHIGPVWVKSARLLVERDERSPEAAALLMRWTQQDPFWRANVLSMPTFRKRYDQLRLARERDLGVAQIKPHHYPGDVDVDQLDEVSRKIHEQTVGR